MKFLSRILRPILLAVVIGTTLIPIGAMAGFKEGLVAHEKGDSERVNDFASPLNIYLLSRV